MLITVGLQLLIGCGSAATSAPAHLTPAASRQLGPLAGTACNARQLWSATAYPMSRVITADLLKTAQRHGASLPDDPQARATLEKAVRSAVFWWTIRSLTVTGQRHNAAALPLSGLKTRDGRALWLVRSGYTANPASVGSCFHGLVHQGGVRHVLNLYDGEMVTADLDDAEAKVVTTTGGTYLHATKGGWRDDMRHAWKAWHDAKDTTRAPELRATYLRSRAAASASVAKLINQTLLRPNGQRPTGHLHVHCGGGMHRTGMVVGVLDRCANGAAMARIAADYKRHVGWRSVAEPGGFEAQNLDFIAHFPCHKLGLSLRK